MSSYIERHLSFGVDEFEGLWKLQFLHPFFYGNEKQYVTVYMVPSNSDYTEAEYKGYEVVKMGANMTAVINKLIPRIQKYPYRWELEGKKLDAFGYDLVSEMAKGSDKVNEIDFTDIAFQEVSRYYSFTENVPAPDIVIETEEVEGNGAMVKLELTMEKAQWVNQISLDFFTEFPVEVKSLMYQEDTMKFAPTYEIHLDETASSSSSLSFGFPSVFAKRIIAILCQPTYTISNVNKTQTELKKEQVWDLLSASVSTNMENILGNEEEWKQNMISFSKADIERKGKTESARETTKQLWRPGYYESRSAHKKTMVDYNKRLQSYQEAESKYKKEMEAYVRYQKDLAEWYRKWGN